MPPCAQVMGLLADIRSKPVEQGETGRLRSQPGMGAAAASPAGGAAAAAAAATFGTPAAPVPQPASTPPAAQVRCMALPRIWYRKFTLILIHPPSRDSSLGDLGTGR